MAPTSPPPDEEEAPSLDLRKEWAWLRSVVYETRCVRVSTSVADGGRWLTDLYVVLDVTDSLAFEHLDDGQYKLTAGKGPTPVYWDNPETGEPERRPSEFDADTYFGKIAGAGWQPVTASRWSVAEQPGEGMLLSVGGQAVLIGEESWFALHRHYDPHGDGVLTAEFAPDHPLNLFRFIAGGAVVAYVMGVRIPEGEEEIAGAIARLVAA